MTHIITRGRGGGLKWSENLTPIFLMAPQGLELKE
jgi:hypothetical protein